MAVGLRWASQVETKPIDWLWDRRIPLGMLTLVEGDGGLGKSTFLFDLAGRVSSGRAMPGSPEREARGVLILTAEDSVEHVVVPRLTNAGADLARVAILEELELGDTAILPTLPSHAADIEAYAEEVGVDDGGFVLIDPGPTYLDPKLSYWNGQHVKQALTPMKRLCERRNCGLILVRNLNKGSGPAHQRGEGSQAWYNVARSVLIVGPDPDDFDLRVIAVNKANLAPNPGSFTYRLVNCDNHQPRVDWQGLSPLTAPDLIEDQERDERGALEGARDWLADFLSEGPVLTTELYASGAKEDHKKITLRRAAEALGVVKEKQSGERGKWVWRLRDHTGQPDHNGDASHIDVQDTLPL
jgi:putative DNA primase/helicase